MKYITTQPITIPAGSEFEIDNETFASGGLHHMSDYCYMHVYLGRAEAIRQGVVVAKPVFKVVA